MYDLPDTEPKENSFALLETGYYSVYIDEYEETTTKRGARMITITYKVTSRIGNESLVPCQNKFLWHNIVFPTNYENQEEPEKAGFMLELIRKFLKTLGEQYRGQITIDPRHWVGKELAVKIKHDEWAGQMREKVHYVLTIDKALEICAKKEKNAGYETSTMVKLKTFEQETIEADDKIPKFLFVP